SVMSVATVSTSPVAFAANPPQRPPFLALSSPTLVRSEDRRANRSTSDCSSVPLVIRFRITPPDPPYSEKKSRKQSGNSESEVRLPVFARVSVPLEQKINSSVGPRSRIPD